MKRLTIILAIVFLPLALMAQDDDETVYLRYKKRASLVSGGSTWLQSTGASFFALTGNGVQIQPCQEGATPTTHCTFAVKSTTPGSVYISMLEEENSTAVSISGGFSCTALTSGVCDGVHNNVDTFSLCSGSACHIANGTNDVVDVAYVAGGAGGAVWVTINYSNTPSLTNLFDQYFQEALPPNCGGTVCNGIVLDKIATLSGGNCSSGCTGTTVTITGTDLMLGALDSANAITAHNYQIEQTGNLFDLDRTTSPAPTVTSSGFVTQVLLFFKSNAGSFTPTPPVFSLVNVAPPGSNTFFGPFTNCNTGCTIAPPSTTSGNLAFVVVIQNGSTMSGLSGRGGTWTVLSNSACPNTFVATLSISCGFATNASGAGNITVTTGSTNNAWVGYLEASRTSGSWVLDTQSGGASAGTTATLTAPSLTFTGPDFTACIWTWTPATPTQNGITLHPYPGGENGWFYGLSTALNQGLMTVLPNTKNNTPPTVKLSGAATTSTASCLAYR